MAHPLSNQNGQAAIFVALMFNVLFVFFAMAINVALVVHDKINLQNSADLAAYYAASKQAELFNAMAHQNYAIRQSWKVLTWRYRVLGTMGLVRDDGRKHPVWTGEMSESPFAPAKSPALCVTYKPTWEEVPPDESLCNRENLKIPALPEVKVIAGFLGINAGIAALSRQLRAQFDSVCQKHGAYNWWYAMSILHAFRLDQRNRKLVIYALAENIANSKNGDFLDLDGNSVLDGARQTFIKNLTYANRQALESFEIMNSLEGVSPKVWLPEVQIVPTVMYVDTKDAESCEADTQPVEKLPQRQEARDLLYQAFPQGLGASDLVPWATAMGGFLKDSDFQFSIGVEKNPWYMAYMGVKARTRPRQIFFPIGSGVEMVARAFAKPFGGRMGPWYSAEWPYGAANSTGRATDTLMAPRMAAGGLMNSADPTTRLPNYSRFPGDTMGMYSKLAMNSLTGLASLGIRFDYYKNIKEDFSPGAPNDVLAWDGSSGKGPEVRAYELSVAAPDLFDITYYSIEPNFTDNYLKRLQANKAAFKIPFDIPVRGDLGIHGAEVPEYNVQQQMDTANTKNLQKSAAFFYVREKAHLLTAWLPAVGGFNYVVQEAMKNFGKCALPDDDLKFTNVGSCAAGGGRTGYSVKLISRDALFSPLHAIGGNNSANAIVNPPSAEF